MLLYNIIERWDNVLYDMYNIFAQLKFIFHGGKERKILRRNIELKNSHDNERCFLVLNGPSVNSHDLSKLRNEWVICANYFYQSKLSDEIRPDFFCWLDSTEIASEKVVGIVNSIRTKFPDGKLIFNLKAYRDETANLPNVFFSYNKHLPHRGSVKVDFDKMCSGFKNVAFYAINAAIYMGFKEIYILGMDFEPSGFIHFEETIQGAMNQLNTENDRVKICDHFWGYAQQHIEAYAISEFAKMKGIKIVNLNKSSYIRAFEFGDFDEVIADNTHH